MQRVAKFTALTFLITLFELFFAKQLAIGAAVPMISFCYVILSAMRESDREAALILGLLTGAFCDILGGHGFGTYTVIFGFTAWETASLCDSILSSRFLFLIINTLLMSIVAGCIYFLFHIIELGAQSFNECFLAIIIPTAVYNTVITMIFYKTTRKRIF